MRVDKYINAVNITKRRSIAQDMIENKIVFVNNNLVKSSKKVEIGDIIGIQYLTEKIEYKVLKIPTTKSIPKSLQDEYVEEIR